MVLNVAPTSRFGDLPECGEIVSKFLTRYPARMGANHTPGPVPSAVSFPNDMNEMRWLHSSTRPGYTAGRFWRCANSRGARILLSQFLSPLFNKRSDAYVGAIANRMRTSLDDFDATRVAVGPDFPIAVKLNSSDQLEGGFNKEDALKVMEALDRSVALSISVAGLTPRQSPPPTEREGPYFLELQSAPAR